MRRNSLATHWKLELNKDGEENPFDIMERVPKENHLWSREAIDSAERRINQQLLGIVKRNWQSKKGSKKKRIRRGNGRAVQDQPEGTP